MPGDGDWPTFQGNRARTGWQRAATAPMPPVDCAWTYETATELDSGVGELSPIAADGTVYLHTGSGTLAALDAATGAERWRREGGSSLVGEQAPPTLRDGRLFVGIEDALHALDPATGETEWAAETSGAVTSSPAVADDTVFVQGGGVAAFDAATGAERWHVDIPTADSSSPAVADGTVYVGSETACLHALDAATGEERWTFELGADPVPDGGVTPAAADDGDDDPPGEAEPADDEWVAPEVEEIEYEDLEFDDEELGLSGDDDTDRSVGGDLSLGPDGVVSTPAVSDGTVFCGGPEGCVYAVDATTGTEVWRADIGETVHGSPAVADGLVFVGSSGFDDNHVYALDAATGDPRWVVGETMEDIRASPAVVDGTVFIGYKGDLYALHTGTGRTIWSVTLRGVTVSSVAVAGGRLFVESNDRYLYALESGSEQEAATEAEATEPGPVGTDQGPPRIGGEAVEDPDPPERERWRVDTGDWVRASPVVVDGTVYVGSDDGHLYALAAATGEERWRFDAGDWVRTAPTVVDGTVYVGDEGGGLYAVDATSGDQLWQFNADMAITESVAVTGGTVYAGSDDGSLHAVDATDGTEAWRFEPGGELVETVASPAVADDTVLVGADDDHLYALAADGTER